MLAVAHVVVQDEIPGVEFNGRLKLSNCFLMQPLGFIIDGQAGMHLMQRLSVLLILLF